jgi:hypothetical protein
LGALCHCVLELLAVTQGFFGVLHGHVLNGACDMFLAFSQVPHIMNMDLYGIITIAIQNHSSQYGPGTWFP